MEPLLARLSPFLHLTRITYAVAAVANVWLVVLWSRLVETDRGSTPARLVEAPLWSLLGAGAVVAVGLFAYAMALNDTLDVRRDRALHPDRPLASGRLSMDAALGVVAAGVIVATLGSLLLGPTAVAMCLATAAAVLLFDAAAKHLPSFGLVLVSLIYALHMLIPNAQTGFLWPVLLAMTHMIVVGAVTHRLLDRRPALTAPALAAAGVGWAFWAAILLVLQVRRAGGLWPADVPLGALLAPALLLVGFAVLAWRKSRSASSRTRAAEKIQRYGSLWLVLYAAAWLFGAGEPVGGWILAGLAAAGFLAMTLLRELFSLIEHPVGYRR